MTRILILVVLVGLSGCDLAFPPGADEKFGDQNFKSAVSAIELHKTRNGTYPDTLADLEYLGDWDGIWVNSVRYEKVESGYNLYVERGFMSEPELKLPAGYKVGLGLVDSNVEWIPEE